MDISEAGLSKQAVYDLLMEALNEDPDLLRFWDDTRMGRLVEALCVAVASVVEANNSAVLGPVAAALRSVEAGQNLV